MQVQYARKNPPFNKGGLGGFFSISEWFFFNMRRCRPYQNYLGPLAQELRKNMTDAEQGLWSKLRRKQILGISFYRQRPIGRFIVDFYAPRVSVVIEIDGSQHLQEQHKCKDEERDILLRDYGIKVLRFNSRETLLEIEGVLSVIYEEVKMRLP